MPVPFATRSVIGNAGPLANASKCERNKTPTSCNSWGFPTRGFIVKSRHVLQGRDPSHPLCDLPPMWATVGPYSQPVVRGDRLPVTQMRANASKGSSRNLRANHPYPPPTYHMPLAEYHQPTSFVVAECLSTLPGVLARSHMSHTHVKGKIKETKIKTATGRGHKAPDPFSPAY